jgi:hypothetical protein
MSFRSFSSLHTPVDHSDNKTMPPAFQWRTAWYPAVAVLAGLVTAQVMATLQVYLSNACLHQSLTTIAQAGYLPVPNQQIMATLRDMSPAMIGGLFFTLTLGAGISLLSFATAWLWDRLFLRSKASLAVFLLGWIAIVAAANWDGWRALTTAWFLAIPAVVSWITLRWMPPRMEGAAWGASLPHLMVIALLASLWLPQMGEDLFVNLRDRLLLSTRVGSAITDLYYRYTLYPARVFKTLDQKTLKTCSLDPGIKDPQRTKACEQLLYHDYLTIRGQRGVDVKINQSDGHLIFRNREGAAILKTTMDHFLAAPAHILKEFSSKADRCSLLRAFTYYGLLMGFPVMLYLLAYTLVILPLSRVVHPGTASVAAMILCLLAGLSLLIPLWGWDGKDLDRDRVEGLLTSGRWQERVKALTYLRKHGIDVSGSPSYQKLLTSPHMPERYWVAKALGVSRTRETYKDLLHLLDDPSPLVTCMALQALGRRGNKDAVKEILNRIRVSDHWYVQWYAYRALKGLGWKQTDSR